MSPIATKRRARVETHQALVNLGVSHTLGPEGRPHVAHEIGFELTELVIHRDAKRLERLPGRVAGASSGSGNGAGDDGGEDW